MKKKLYIFIDTREENDIEVRVYRSSNIKRVISQIASEYFEDIDYLGSPLRQLNLWLKYGDIEIKPLKVIDLNNKDDEKIHKLARIKPLISARAGYDCFK
jgi:hypothetical protein